MDSNISDLLPVTSQGLAHATVISQDQSSGESDEEGDVDTDDGGGGAGGGGGGGREGGGGGRRKGRHLPGRPAPGFFEHDTRADGGPPGSVVEVEAAANVPILSEDVLQQVQPETGG